jgi:hypothetical protein
LDEDEISGYNYKSKWQHFNQMGNMVPKDRSVRIIRRCLGNKRGEANHLEISMSELLLSKCVSSCGF